MPVRRKFLAFAIVAVVLIAVVAVGVVWLLTVRLPWSADFRRVSNKRSASTFTATFNYKTFA